MLEIDVALRAVADAFDKRWRADLAADKEWRFTLRFPAPVVEDGAHGRFWTDTLADWRAWESTLDPRVAAAVRLIDGPRTLAGIRHQLPTTLRITSARAAALLLGGGRAERLESAVSRIRDVEHVAGRPITDARTRRLVIDLTETGTGYLLSAARWFVENSASGLTARGVPLPSVPGKWLEKNLPTLSRIVGRPIADELVPRRTVASAWLLDPEQAARCGTSAISVSEDVPPPFHPRFVLVTENAEHLATLPACRGGIVVDGRGTAAAWLARAAWIEGVPLLYWGDMDAEGFGILNDLRAHGLRVVRLLMDASTFQGWSALGTSTQADGRPITSRRRDLPHLSVSEHRAFSRTTGTGSSVRRIEQEKLQLGDKELALLIESSVESWHTAHARSRT